MIKTTYHFVCSTSKLEFSVLVNIKNRNLKDQQFKQLSMIEKSRKAKEIKYTRTILQLAQKFSNDYHCL